MTYMEWPQGSGRIANYSDAELAYIRVFIRQHEAGEITAEVMERQISHCHDLKIEFGVDLIKDDSGPVVIDMAAARAARDQAIKRVDTNADPTWKTRALMAVADVARAKETLISDDVWIHLGWMPIEPRAIGPVMLAAAKRGYIERIDGEMRQAHRIVNHARPQQVWRSLLYRS